jgi:precorrin-6B methylase 2
VADYALAISDAELARYRMMARTAVAAEADELERAGVTAGATVADVGAGPAAMSVELAALVGPTGRVVAIEPDDRSRATAASVIEASGRSNVELRAGTATASTLQPGSVQVAMLRHVLAHNGGREQEIVDHLTSVVRPGGAVYLVDVDLTSIRLLDAGNGLSDLQEKYAQFHRARGDDPQIGLRLARLLTAADLEVLTFVGRYTIITAPPGLRPPAWAARDAMLSEGAVTEADLARWEAAFAAADAAPTRPTIFVPNFVAVGRRRE